MQLIIDITTRESVVEAREMLKKLITQGIVGPTGAGPSVDDTTDDDGLDVGGLGSMETVVESASGDMLDMLNDDSASDDLGGLLEDSEPKPPTIPDLQASIKAAIALKKKDPTMDMAKKMITKLGAKNLSEVPEDKRKLFIDAITTWANK